ncbi:MAG: prephenate dehydratase [Chloroflexi bacterium]|nr:prephenate dehydratase [Chloroflexota bacterium]
MSIEDLRKRIDEIDAQVVGLVAERMRVAGQIGEEKKKEGRQITDNERERLVIERVKSIALHEKIDPQDIESLYRLLMTISRNVQGMTVAFQGELGAYSEGAAFQFFGHSVSVKPCETLDEVFRRVEVGEVQYGIVPIENSLEGSISRVYDLLLDSSLRVCGETEFRVSHCLIAKPGVKLDSIRRVYSHPQALGQCQAYLRHMNFEIIPSYDTAGSVKMIKEKGITDGAAIASARSAEIYGMEILAREIEDNPNNFTRFFILAKEDSPPTGNDKTSIVFAVKHRPGALYEFLKDLAERKINLTKIESRPTRQKPWEYNFYLDFEGHRLDEAPSKALEHLKDSVIFLKVLGSYPRAR